MGLIHLSVKINFITSGYLGKSQSKKYVNEVSFCFGRLDRWSSFGRFLLNDDFLKFEGLPSIRHRYQ
jgi:hypothetical protein